jgi:hypothetical protein
MKTEDTFNTYGTFNGPVGEVRWVTDGNTVYPTTPCCGAIATGSMEGTACRACYTELDDYFGIAFSMAEVKSGKAARFMNA